MATNSNKIWSNKDNQKLIQLVKENVILWETRNDEEETTAAVHIIRIIRHFYLH